MTETQSCDSCRPNKPPTALVSPRRCVQPALQDGYKSRHALPLPHDYVVFPARPSLSMPTLHASRPLLLSSACITENQSVGGAGERAGGRAAELEWVQSGHTVDVEALRTG